jgi:hypothetical protein
MGPTGPRGEVGPQGPVGPKGADGIYVVDILEHFDANNFVSHYTMTMSDGSTRSLNINT